MPLGSKLARLKGSHALHRLIEGIHEKFSLSETIRHRALIFSMQYQLVDLYKLCSNYVPGAKMAPPWGHLFNIGLYREKDGNIFLSETIRSRALIFYM